MILKGFSFFLLLGHSYRTHEPVACILNPHHMDLTFKAENNISGLLQEGDHVVTIKELSLDQPRNSSDDYSDKTPQLKVQFRNDDGIFTAWYNLLGYKTFEELSEEEIASGKYEARGDNGVAVDVETNKRVVSPKKTASARSIVGRLGTNSGIEAGSDFTPAQLQGREVGIHIERNKQGNLRVKSSMDADSVMVEA